MDASELQSIKNRYDIIGNDAGLNYALETAVRCAPTDLPVLISGESGVGKETLPKIIHQFSLRKNGKFLAVNCGAIPEGTINAELFGHEKGAFTGAIGERKGYFEEANGGTLFLDEIGELPRETQALLLRVLQNGEYLKVGSSKVQKTDVRVICATNLNLAHAVSTGRFRPDLYFRLNGIQIQVPSLRDRKNDIYLLFRKFSSDFSEKYHLSRLELSHDAISALTAYRWPGNIRQLKNVAESITAMESVPMAPGAQTVVLPAQTLAKYLPDEKDSLLPGPVTGHPSQGMSDGEKQMIIKAILDLKQEVDELRQELGAKQQRATLPAAPERADYYTPPQDEPEDQIPEEHPAETAAPLSLKRAGDDMIERALARHGGNVKEAAAELGISERTIYRRNAKKKQA
ncbi:MAG: sigma-54-dependent Fis family transcriptional regulator [Bacteroidales bacterium]|nr:sigma-54-dependent Fis family transcriptional regulator [Bacteroidales bacterium]